MSGVVTSFVRTARVVIAPVWFAFALTVLGGLLVSWGGIYQALLVGAILPQLQQAPGSAQGAARDGMWLDALVPNDLVAAAVALAITIVSVIVLKFLVDLLKQWTTAEATGRLQETLHRRILTLGPEWHDRKKPVDGLEVTEFIGRGITPFVIEVIRYPLIAAGSLVAAFAALYAKLGEVGQLPPLLRYLAVGLVFVVPLVATWLSERQREAYDASLQSDNKLRAELMNSLLTPVDIRAVGGVPGRIAAVAAAIRQAVAARFRVALEMGFGRQFTESVTPVLQGVFLIYGVWATVQAAQTGRVDMQAIGAIVAIYMLLPQVVEQLTGLVGFLSGVNAQWPMVQRVAAVLEAAPAATATADPAPWPEGEGELALRRVTLAFEPGGRKVLDGVEHVFARGKITAIVGRSGCGKSTVLRLVARLRPPTAGAIEVDGVGIDRFDEATLRARIAVVTQQSLVLDGTVRANLALSHPQASDADMEAAAKRTGLWRILTAKDPEKPLDIVVPREAGGTLSGGERRILSITRALLGRPSVLLLDEPSTGIDAESLGQVVDAIREAGRSVTTILVDHDLDLVQALAQEACVLEGGRFAQIGPPAKLAAEQGPFRDLLEARERITGGERGMKVEAFPMPPETAFTPPKPGEVRVAVGAPMKMMRP
jgi:ABC-type multidrug transport system fused ATPase/permease subunit